MAFKTRAGQKEFTTIPNKDRQTRTSTPQTGQQLLKMMAAMKIALMLVVAVLAFVMLADARQLLDYDDCRRGETLFRVGGQLISPRNNSQGRSRPMAESRDRGAISTGLASRSCAYRCICLMQVSQNFILLSVGLSSAQLARQLQLSAEG